MACFAAWPERIYVIDRRGLTPTRELLPELLSVYHRLGDPQR